MNATRGEHSPRFLHGLGHFALAPARAPLRAVEGVAAVRYVRDNHQSECAEVALTVVDGWLRCGIATRLTSHLLAVLPTYGKTTVRLHWLQDNEPVERLIRRLLSNGQRYSENGVITGEFRIDTQQADAA